MDKGTHQMLTKTEYTGKCVVAYAQVHMCVLKFYQTENCACARKTLQTYRERTHGAVCLRQWFRTAEPLGERRYDI